MSDRTEIYFMCGKEHVAFRTGLTAIPRQGERVKFSSLDRAFVVDGVEWLFREQSTRVFIELADLAQIQTS